MGTPDRTSQTTPSVGRRIVIIGSGGSGKSTVARQLSATTELPVTHLDVLWYQPRWVTAAADEALAAVRDVTSGDSWIIEGSFLDQFAIDGRRERADTVIYLDRSPALCVVRTLRRWLLGRGRARADLPFGCSETFDWSNLLWVARFRRNDRPQVLQVMAQLPVGVVTHRLRYGTDVKRLLMASRK